MGNRGVLGPRSGCALLIGMLLVSFWPTDAEAQRIRFDPDGLSVRLVPFASFPANVGDFYANSGGQPFGTPTIDTPLVPTDLVQLPDGRYLVNTLGGTIKLLSPQGSIISNLMGPDETGTNYADPVRYGSTALALHPNFGSTDVNAFGRGKAYGIAVQPASEASRRPGQPETGVIADFTTPEEVPAGTPLPGNGWTGGSAFAYQPVLREYDLSGLIDQQNPVTSYVGNAPPTRDILRIDQPGASHGMFDIEFNANGDLFVTVGDGGFTELGPDFPGRNRRQSAQNLNEVFGKVLRINPDVDAANAGRVGDNGQYSIPSDNPYFDNTTDPKFDFINSVFTDNDGTLDEIYANGIRSPFRLERDPRDATGNTLVLSDVGEGSREEATRFSKGDNLGWGRIEGNILSNSGVDLKGETTLTAPGLVYQHGPRSLSRSGGKINTFRVEAGGQSISGGVIYAGDLLGEDFQGLYIGADLGAHNGDPNNLSRLIVGNLDGPPIVATMLNIDPAGQLFTAPVLEASDFPPGFNFDAPGVDFDGQGGRLLPELILGIHVNNAGEMFVLGSDRLGNNTISRIVSAELETVPGDYNLDGLVDAADYTVWRDNLGSSTSLPNDDTPGVGDDDYGRWKENFGQGAGSGSHSSHVVPEPRPVAFWLLASALLLVTYRRAA